MQIRKASDRGSSPVTDPVTTASAAAATSNLIADADASQMVRRAQQRDPSAIEGLYRLYADRVFRYLFYRTGERSRAEELTGDVFLRVLENIKDFHLGRSDQALALTAWIYRIAHNLMVDDYRRQKAKGIAEPLPDEVDDYLLAHDPEEWHLTRADLQMAMLRLTDEQQTVVLFRFQDGLTSLEISKILGKTETAVKALQRRALRRLARLLSPQTEIESEQGNIARREGDGRPC